MRNNRLYLPHNSFNLFLKDFAKGQSLIGKRIFLLAQVKFSLFLLSGRLWKLFSL